MFSLFMVGISCGGDPGTDDIREGIEGELSGFKQDGKESAGVSEGGEPEVDAVY